MFLTDDQIQTLRRMLERDLKRALRAHGELGAESGDDGSRGDLADRGNGVAARENLALLAGRHAPLVTLLHDALRRLNEEPQSFGACATCGEPIPFARLEILPHAQTCAAHSR